MTVALPVLTVGHRRALDSGQRQGHSCARTPNSARLSATRDRVVAALRRLGPLLVLGTVSALPLTACRNDTALNPAEQRAISDTLTKLVTNAYDLSKPNQVARLASLYPDSGRVISAAAGRVTTTRAALMTELESFWTRVGQNMQHPQFVLGSTYVDVITRDAAVMTLTYSIPHHTPAGAQHTVSGAWTALWRRQKGQWKIVQEHLSDTPESTASTAPSASAHDTMSGHDSMARRD